MQQYTSELSAGRQRRCVCCAGVLGSVATAKREGSGGEGERARTGQRCRRGAGAVRRYMRRLEAAPSASPSQSTARPPCPPRPLSPGQVEKIGLHTIFRAGMTAGPQEAPRAVQEKSRRDLVHAHCIEPATVDCRWPGRRPPSHCCMGGREMRCSAGPRSRPRGG